MRYLADWGADLNKCSNDSSIQTRYTPLHIAAKNGHTETVRALLENNAITDIAAASTATNSRYAIHLACEYGHFDIVKLLLEANPGLLNQPDSRGQTPVLWAASRGHESIVRYLAEGGADLNQTTNGPSHPESGYTPTRTRPLNRHCDERY